MLKDGSSTEDIRLDRVIEFDERSKAFPVSALAKRKRKPKSNKWRCRMWLNQMAEGSCVGCGIAHELAARPAEVRPMTFKYAKEKIYWEAQKIDPWPGGAFPKSKPFYEGTTVLAGVKIAHKLGWFEKYRWAFSLKDLKLGVGYNGPAVMGLKWYAGMRTPDKKGYIHPTGKLIGGHCILCNGVDIKNKRFTLHNSWGKSWGRNGECFISFKDMDKLLHREGEAVFFEKRHLRPKPKK